MEEGRFYNQRDMFDGRPVQEYKNEAVLMSSVRRTTFWTVGILLYLSAHILNLCNISGITTAFLSFLIYLFIIIFYFSVEPEDHFRNIAILLILLGVFMYPFTYRATENAGVYFAFKPREDKLTEFAKEINSYKNISQISDAMLNYDFIDEDRYIFDNYGVDESKFKELNEKMKQLGINTVKITRNHIYVYTTTGLGKLLYINKVKPDLTPLTPEGVIDIYLGNNWYKWSYN